MTRKRTISSKHRKSRIFGTHDRPRLYIFRSNKNIYAQLINDMNGYTLSTVSTLNPNLKSILPHRLTCKSAQLVGELLAREALKREIYFVVFDRGKNLYHGKIKALAEAAREKGLVF